MYRLDDESLAEFRKQADVKANFIRLIFQESKRKAIGCLWCGMISYNENDYEQRYCASCKEFFALMPFWTEAAHA